MSVPDRFLDPDEEDPPICCDEEAEWTGRIWLCPRCDEEVRTDDGPEQDFDPAGDWD